MDRKNKKPVLSICIPVYNRKMIFKSMLKEVCESLLGYENETEIVISDNASLDNLAEVIKEISHLYPTVDFKYYKNKENIGLAANFMEVASKANGIFCWIIGSDDFVKRNAVKKLLNIIKSNQDVDLIVVNKDHVNFGNNLEKIKNPREFLNLTENISVNTKSPTKSFKAKNLDEVVNLSFNNVLLGAVMVNVFRKSIWNKVEIPTDRLQGFNNLTSIYPHCYIFAKGFFNSNCYYEADSLITTSSYEGIESWQSSNLENFWLSNEPILYFNVLLELLDAYKLAGLNRKSYRQIKRVYIQYPARLVVPIFVRKYIQKKEIHNSKKINLSKLVKENYYNVYLYKGILKGAIKLFLLKKIY